MVAEDEVLIRLDLVEMLTEEGYDVVGQAGDGEAAVELATELVVGTMAGTAALLEHRGGDTLAVRREVTSPGGITARGLEALEQGGIRAAFLAAMQQVAAR